MIRTESYRLSFVQCLFIKPQKNRREKKERNTVVSVCSWFVQIQSCSLCRYRYMKLTTDALSPPFSPFLIFVSCFLNPPTHTNPWTMNMPAVDQDKRSTHEPLTGVNSNILRSLSMSPLRDNPLALSASAHTSSCKTLSWCWWKPTLGSIRLDSLP